MSRNSLPLLVMLLKVLLHFFLLTSCNTTTTKAAYFNFDLSTTTLDPTINGFTAKGEVVGNGFGRSVSTAGDINNDGYDDIIVGAPWRSGNQGAAYVIYGKEKTLLSNLDLSATALDPSTTGFRLIGSAASNFFGWSVDTAGDINKDGYDDILIGAYGYGDTTGNNRGAVYVIYGGEKSLMKNYDFSLAATILDPATTGFVIKGNAALSQLGISVSTAGDINKDGYDDIIIGAPNKNSNQGAAYVIYGGPKSSMTHIDLSSPTALNPLQTGFMITGNAIGNQLGYSVSHAGDINKDGYGDIIVGAPNKNSNRGVAYVIYGGPKSSMTNIDLSNPTTILDPLTTGFMIAGEAINNYFGSSVNTVEDINKDGYDDIIIGAYGRDLTRGAVYVFYGGEKSSMLNIDLSSPTTILDPLTTGFMITGNAASNQFGVSTSSGDINKDGYSDMIIGANMKNAFNGAVYVIYGGKKSSMSNLDLSNPATILDPLSTGFLIPGNAGTNNLGYSVKAGDINNDGYKDIIFASHRKDSSQGMLYVIHTACSPCWNCPTDCYQCSSASTCVQCSSPSFLYESQCYGSCPAATFSSSNSCKDCPPFCSSCTSYKSCQICESGYVLSNSICVVPSLSAGAKALKAASSVSKGVGSVVSAGSSIFPLSAIVSKIVQNTRYLNLTVTNELADIYQTWDTDLINWQVPNGFSSLDHYKTSPFLFARYEIDSPFLTNFWPTMFTSIISLFTFMACFGLQIIFERAECHRCKAYYLLQKLVVGSFNFTLVQTYGCLDDVLFYLVIDVKTNPFGNFFSWASIIVALIFMTLGCSLLSLNFWKVKKYQSFKKRKEDLKAFTENNKYWELFYSDFNDDDFWSQSFLALYIIRSSLSSLIIAALYHVVLFQTTSLLILDGAVLLYLFSKKPFNMVRGKFAQYYFETITVLVHICTFALSLDRSSENIRLFCSTAIIYLNTALVSGSTGFMFIEIYETIKENSQKRKKGGENVPLKIAPVAEETLDSQKNDLSCSNPNQSSWTETQSIKVKNQHQHQKSVRPFQTLESENSVISHLNTSNLYTGSRDKGPVPVIVQRRPFDLKQLQQQQQQQQERNISMIKNYALNLESLEEN